MDESEISVSITKETGSAERIVDGDSNKPQEKQNSYMKTGGECVKEILNPEGSYPYTWNKIFLSACVFAVATDPLFFYIPTIHDHHKCLGTDNKLKIVALVLRSISDVFYITDIYYQILNRLKMANSSRVALITRTLWPYFIITDVLGVLPLPQVAILIFYPKLRGSTSWDTRKFLNFLVISQYVLRIVRTYLSTKELKKTPRALGPLLNGVLNLFLYITASHVLGAFWYFLSVQRQTACWQGACKVRSSGCVSTTFECNDSNINASVNQTFLNEFCPVNPPNATVFDFGIFLDALQQGLIGPINFPKKFVQCYWWGLQNLSTFGQNLKTSTYPWEACFAILISLIGLVLFLYLIGNLQTYMQLATTKSEEIRQTMKIKEQEIELITREKLPDYIKIVLVQHIQYAIQHDKDVDLEDVFASLRDQKGVLKKEELELTCRKLEATGSKKHEMQMKELSANLWMQKNMITENMIPNKNMKHIILQHVRCRLEDNKDIDVKNMLSILPIEYKESLKKHLCLASLKKVPILQNMGVKVLESFVCYLKPVVYSEQSYIIRKGEPLDLMFFITQGVAWSYTANDENASNFTYFERLEKGDYYGEELLNRTLTLPDLHSSFPVSTLNVRSHTKVEALVLTANDLIAVKDKYDWLFSNNDGTSFGPAIPKQEFASQTIKLVWRRHIAEKSQRRHLH